MSPVARFIIYILPVLTAQAQSTMSPIHRYAWAANAGWLDFLPGYPEGVKVTEFWLSGYAWAANVGWIHFGDDSPENGHTYSNTAATDYGVNLDSSGGLTGFAWSPNAGWITFEQSHGRPRLDYLSGIFTGYAWSGNLGWISLNTNYSTLATDRMDCQDIDADGIGDAWEMRYFSSLAAAGAFTDSDADGESDAAEYGSGTNPRDPESLLRIVSHHWSFDAPAGSSLRLTFTSAANRLYRIEHDDELTGIWPVSPPGLFSPDAGGITSRTVQFSNTDRHYVRVMALRPLQP